ncbi:Fc.00g060880.m01.CDS01 [Cosmosporella sp. VM-42]
MATTVTYDGVESSSGGNIFKDVKFWVAHQVPTRNLILNMIKNNGGTVVVREKDADMLIADHARKNTPAGSYSWRFITESVEHGIIQPKDHHLCGRDPDLPRPVGGGGVMKGRRTPFSSADDALLAKWVLLHPGERNTGNRLYQEYEKINPRHTWQSWRNRYVKTLQFVPAAKLERMAASAPEERATSSDNRPQPEPEPEQRQQTIVVRPENAEPRQRREPSRPIQPAEDARRGPPIEYEHEEPSLFVEDEIEHNEEIEEEIVEDDVFEEVAPRSQLEPSPVPESLASYESDTAKQDFYDDLNEFMKANEYDIKPRPNINGTVIELWDLARAVQMQQENSQEVDWPGVAVDLGLPHQNQITLSQLRDCYEENLVEFLEAMQSFELDAEGGEDGDEEVTFEGFGQEPEEVHPPARPDTSRSTPAYVPSSPPVGAGTKRPLARDLTSSGPSSKRQRYDRNAEIPSTPDEKIGVVRPLISTRNLSPSIRRNLLQQEYIDSEASQQLPLLPEAMLEVEQSPEDEEVQEIGEEEEEEEEEEQPPPTLDTQRSYDITPSQQLRREVNPSPIPFNIDKGRQSKKPVAASKSTPQPERQAQPSRRSQETKPADTPITKTTTPITTTPALRPKPPRHSMPSSRQTPLRRIPGALPPRPTPLRESNKSKINYWIAHYESAGFPHDVVVEGLKRTTLTPGDLATLVMQSLKDGKEVPTHHEGIWTDRDDADLNLAKSVDIDRLGSNAEEERLRRRAKHASDRLVNKHGQGGVDLRKAYLEAQNLSANGSSGR